MGVGHARIEFEARIAAGIFPDAIADFRHAVVRRAHEDADTLVVSTIQNVHDGLQILEAHGLRPSLFFGHVVDAEELIIAE